MTRHRTKEQEVRRMLDLPHPVVPADLHVRAAHLGMRLLRRRRALHRAGWALLCVAVIAFTVWAVSVEPWNEPPSMTTPEIEGW